MNIIDAIINLANHPIIHLVHDYQGRNRANNAGDALEEYTKDLFAGIFDLPEAERLEKINQVFSYLGNNSNPPDAMLRGGDAIEVKKIESEGAALALNSSYPKHTILSSSPMISSACKAAEAWAEKDIIYTVGVVDKHTNDLKRLCMVYGLDYCASDECYSRIKTTIKNGVEAIPGIEFAESRELGHINKVDPLGITYMRVRGMWGIDNPWNVFSYIYTRNSSYTFDFMCIINSSKWGSLDNTDELIALANNNASLKITDVRIKNPDNPAQLRDAKLITFGL
ncbi:MAG: NgoPII family restriction endonuclease [Oscillospiraceae bacterium]|nr:NgoPII family restriction endonuclease [Oscillospiraceae bacterium]